MNLRETDDAYVGEIHRRGKWRVAICRDGIQYLLQRRGKAVGAAWASQHYCTTRKALSRLWRSQAGGDATKIDALPERARDYHPKPKEQTND